MRTLLPLHGHAPACLLRICSTHLPAVLLTNVPPMQPRAPARCPCGQAAAALYNLPPSVWPRQVLSPRICFGSSRCTSWRRFMCMRACVQCCMRSCGGLWGAWRWWMPSVFALVQHHVAPQRAGMAVVCVPWHREWQTGGLVPYGVAPMPDRRGGAAVSGRNCCQSRSTGSGGHLSFLRALRGCSRACGCPCMCRGVHRQERVGSGAQGGVRAHACLSVWHRECQTGGLVRSQAGSAAVSRKQYRQMRVYVAAG